MNSFDQCGRPLLHSMSGPESVTKLLAAMATTFKMPYATLQLGSTESCERVKRVCAIEQETRNKNLYISVKELLAQSFTQIKLGNVSLIGREINVNLIVKNSKTEYQKTWSKELFYLRSDKSTLHF